MAWSADEVAAYAGECFQVGVEDSENPVVARAAEALRAFLQARFDSSPTPSRVEDALRQRAKSGDRQALWASIAPAVFRGDNAFGAGYFKRLARSGDFEAAWAIDAARYVFERTGSPTEAILASLFAEIDKIDEGIAALELRDDPFARRALRTLRRAAR